MFNIIFVVQVIDHMFITTDLLLHDYRDLGKFTSTMNLVEKIPETCSSLNMPELENLQKTDSEPVWRHYLYYQVLNCFTGFDLFS